MAVVELNLTNEQLQALLTGERGLGRRYFDMTAYFEWKAAQAGEHPEQKAA